MRTESIAVSESEKSRLNGVAEEIYGTTEVPYGAVVSGLIEEYESGAQSGE